jgi:sulfatase maturation enzyme AslB (radical SAM superfamily)
MNQPVDDQEQFLCSKMFTDLNIKFAYNTVKNCCKTNDYRLPTESVEKFKGAVFFKDKEFVDRKLSMIKDNKLSRDCESCIKTHPNSLFRVWNEWPQKLSQAQKDALLDKDNFSLYELVLSNACDLMCVYCSEKDSTSWAREKGVAPIVGDPIWKEKVLESFFAHLRGKIFIDKKDYWFFFSGGEPTYNPETIQVISKIIEIVPHASLNLIITTNVNARPEVFKKYLDLVDAHKDIRWRFDCSLDGLFAQSEAIRYGLKWGRAVANISELLKRDNVQTCINPTLNVFSVPGLPDFISYFVKMFSEHGKVLAMGANMVAEDDLCIMLLPEKYKIYLDQAIAVCESANMHYREKFIQHLGHAKNLIGTEGGKLNHLQNTLLYFKMRRPETDYLGLFPHVKELLNDQRGI